MAARIFFYIMLAAVLLISKLCGLCFVYFLNFLKIFRISDLVKFFLCIFRVEAARLLRVAHEVNV